MPCGHLLPLKYSPQLQPRCAFFKHLWISRDAGDLVGEKDDPVDRVGLAVLVDAGDLVGVVPPEQLTGGSLDRVQIPC